jgi:hypothetical protein
MKIFLRAIISAEIKREILRHEASLTKQVDLSELVIEADTDSDIWDKIIAISKNIKPLSFSARMEFDENDMKKELFFSIDFRGKAKHLSDSDKDFNYRQWEQTEYIQTAKKTRIKIPSVIGASKINIKPNNIGGPDIFNEFILPSSLGDLFIADNLSGFELRPIVNPKTGAKNSDYSLLYCDKIMPPAVYDTTTQVYEDPSSAEKLKFRFLGCLTYDIKASLKKYYDFNRTTEGWAAYDIPEWVVSARVKDCYERNKLKGWWFRPVLEKGSELHWEYLQKWESLFTRIMVNPKNRIS